MSPVNARRPQIRRIPISPPRFADEEPISGIITKPRLREDDDYEEVDETELVLIAND